MSRQAGHRWERFAESWLRKRKVRILHRNFQCALGEIDLVAKDGSDIAFIEVKYRTLCGHGLGLEHVTRTKQQRIVRTARHYLQYHRFPATQVFRFDVISIDRKAEKGSIRWIKNAFWAR